MDLMDIITPESLLKAHLEYRKERRRRKIKITIIIILAALMLFYIGASIYVYTANKLEVKAYRYQYLEVPQIEINLSKKECKRLVDDLYNFPHLYFEISRDEGRTLGHTIFIPPIAIMNKHLQGQEFIIHYAHELTHSKYLTQNETWVTFKTFTLLYESDNEVLHNSGLLYAKWIVEGGYAGTDYDCGYYILEYFSKK